jgi:predicted HAD superfamily phosphohydrolase YqeG
MKKARHAKDLIDSARAVMQDWSAVYAKENITPDFRVKAFGEITPPMLQDITTLVLDVDGVLTGYRETDVRFPNTVKQLSQKFKTYIVSNSGEDRYRQLGTIMEFFNIPILTMYQSADGSINIYRALQHGWDVIWTEKGIEKIPIKNKINAYDRKKHYGDVPEELAERYPGVKFKKVKKPNTALADYVKILTGARGGEIVYIGDRLSTEISMAGQTGSRKILVDELKGKREEPLSIRLFGRPVERYYARKYKLNAY